MILPRIGFFTRKRTVVTENENAQIDAVGRLVTAARDATRRCETRDRARLALADATRRTAIAAWARDRQRAAPLRVKRQALARWRRFKAHARRAKAQLRTVLLHSCYCSSATRVLTLEADATRRALGKWFLAAVRRPLSSAVASLCEARAELAQAAHDCDCESLRLDAATLARAAAETVLAQAARDATRAANEHARRLETEKALLQNLRRTFFFFL